MITILDILLVIAIVYIMNNINLKGLGKNNLKSRESVQPEVLDEGIQAILNMDWRYKGV